MNYKVFNIIILISLILATDCSNLNKIIHHPDIYQGNYFTSSDISKIHTGMTQQQIIQILGTPMIIDPFDTNTWFYISRYQTGHKQHILQETLTLIFNKNGILINMKHSPVNTVH